MKTELKNLTDALTKIVKADRVRIISSAPIAQSDNIQVTVIAMDFKHPGPADKFYPRLPELIRLTMNAVYPEQHESDCICEWDINGGWACWAEYITCTLTLYTEL